MIVANEQDLTAAVLAEAARATDPRFRELLTLAVQHLHAFVREARLSEVELLHLLITKPGFKAQFSQVYSADDPPTLAVLPRRAGATAGS